MIVDDRPKRLLGFLVLWSDGQLPFELTYNIRLEWFEPAFEGGIIRKPMLVPYIAFEFLHGLGGKTVSGRRKDVTVENHENFIGQADQTLDEVRYAVRWILEDHHVPPARIKRITAEVERPFQHQNAVALFGIHPLIVGPQVDVSMIAIGANGG